jgi:hypothetical protein
MKWTLASNSSSDIREYHLIKDELTLVIMKYRPEQQTVRITHEGDRLVFFMENSGYANRVVFKNVYGVDLGKYTYNNRNHNGRLEINNDIFDYNIVNGNQPRLIIHRHNKQEPMATCQIPDEVLQPASLYEHAGIVLSMCSLTGVPQKFLP